jgi:predicted  nucleic acid-binding Zn-ribbon protein
MSLLNDLYDLDGIDDEIDRQVEVISKIDLDLKGNNKIIEVQRAVQKTKSIFSNQDIKRRDLELSAETIQSKVTSVEVKLYGGSVRNPKELEDLQLELNNLKVRKETEENSYLEAMGEAEETGSKLAKLEHMLQELEDSWENDQKRLAVEKLVADRSLIDLKEKRNAMSLMIDARSLFIYDRVRLKRKGQAVARVERGICQGCNISLPTNTVQQARMQEVLLQCPSCTRLLYVI